MFTQKPVTGVRGAALSLSLIAGIVAWGASVAQATPQNGLNPNETLAQLIALNGPGGGVQIGNLIFNNFAYVGSPSPNPAPDSAHISVANSPFPGTGLEFVAGWQAFAGGSPQESKVSYLITSTTGFVLTQVRLDFNGDAPSPAAGTAAEVTESVYNVDGSGNPIGSPQQLSVFNNTSNGSASGNTSSLTLPSPQAGVFIQKDILLTGAGTGVSSISFVDNTYTVAVGSPIPEPASMGLLGTFALGLLARRRRA